eukprot:XP_011681180.1 PREDICTED: uncharacterized protein LOC100893948 [Strongylocentrotus purpuratus]
MAEECIIPDHLASEDDILHKQVERFWQMDSAGTILGQMLGESRLMTRRPEENGKIYEENKIGNYPTQLPWKDAALLPNNRHWAEARTAVSPGKIALVADIEGMFHQQFLLQDYLWHKVSDGMNSRGTEIQMERVARRAAPVSDILLKMLKPSSDKDIKTYEPHVSASFSRGNESRRFHTFVANRIAKIHDVSDPSQWRHVDTKSNPADDGSRGLHAIEMTKDCRWITGPKYLWESETHWPPMPSVLEGDHIDSQTNLEGDPEAKKCHVNITKSTDVNTTDSIKKLMERHSTWNRLKRGVGWILRYKQYLRSKKSQRFSSDDGKSDLTAHELNAAETAIIQYAQYQAFPDQFMLRAEGKSTRTNKRLGKLNPIIKDGLLRVGGRLGKAPIGEDEKHPLILPYDHHITALLIVHHHTKVGHSGAGLTWTSLREKYWVIRGGATVRRVIGKCFECKRRNAPRGEQFMADLPLSRVTPDKPAFTNTGIDFFGPFTVKQGRTTRKRYGCIFTCLASRAVHLEVASSLDTDSFLNALRRFMNRRGQPEKILSDNGTNFKGGERELRESLSSLNSSKIGRILGQKGIHWEFNPPGASHMGGAWERIIRSVRKILRSLLGQQLLSDEALTTYMTEVEAILNSRPLTQLSMDPRDEEPLTPNHLLLLRKTSPLPPGIFSKEDSYSRRRWRQVQYLADQFWKRWVREYLPILQERQKWSRPKRNFTVDDLVLIVNDQTPRGQWALGRITQTYPDKRG